MIGARVTLAAEGNLDLAVLRRLIGDAGFTPGAEYGRRGKAQIDARINQYNKAARHAPWIVLRDLDRDSNCAGELATRLLKEPSELMIFRIAVREVEAWLLADADRFAQTFKVTLGAIPKQPEGLLRPKAQLLDIVAKSSSRDVKLAMVIRSTNGSLAIGPEYNALLEDFASTTWKPAIAAKYAPSLAKARLRIRELGSRL